MAINHLQVNRVLMLCACGKRNPICKLYFCRHCSKLRCGECVCNEVDSHYCPNCLENMPSAEAKLKKNRCANCFDCPSCRHTLSTRATSVSVPDPKDPSKSSPHKVYYLACAFCRWTSRDAGIPDQKVATGGWQELENVNAKRINTVLEYYKQLSQREKAEKDRKKYTRRRGFMHLSDKYGLASVAAARRKGLLSMASLSLKEGEDSREPEVDSAVAVGDVEPLPADFYTKPLTLANVTTIQQRLSVPEFQPKTTDSLYPIHKHLLIKRSQRCRDCEHNLTKPDFNPSSIKFKIQLVAIFHVPEIRIRKNQKLVYNQENEIELTLVNPAQNVTNVTLLPVDPDLDDFSTAKVELPATELVLAPRDDAAEFDDVPADQSDYNDDKSIIVFRKANKIGFRMKIIPNKAIGDVKISFRLKHDYINTTVALQSESQEPSVSWLQHNVFVNLGPVTQ